jgi:hypothetical protein
MFFRHRLIVAWLAFACLPAIGSDKSDWLKARREGTIGAYQGFISKHPKSDHIDAAHEAVAILEAKARSDCPTLFNALNNLHLRPKEGLLWQCLQANPTADGYRQFSLKFPSSSHVSEGEELARGWVRKTFGMRDRIILAVEEEYFGAPGLHLPAKEFKDLVGPYAKAAGLEISDTPSADAVKLRLSIKGSATQEQWRQTRTDAKFDLYTSASITGTLRVDDVGYRSRESSFGGTYDLGQSEFGGSVVLPNSSIEWYSKPSSAPFDSALHEAARLGFSGIWTRIVGDTWGPARLVVLIRSGRADYRVASEFGSELADALRPELARLEGKELASVAAALGWLGDPRSLPVLARWREFPKNSREEMVDALGGLGPQVYDILSPLLKDFKFDFDYSNSASCAIGRTKDPRAYDALMNKLNNRSDPYGRHHAVCGLGELGDARAIDPLKRELEYASSASERASIRDAIAKIEAAGSRGRR